MTKKTKRKGKPLSDPEKKLLEKPIETRLKEDPNINVTTLTETLLKEHDIPLEKLESARGHVSRIKRVLIEKGAIESGNGEQEESEKEAGKETKKEEEPEEPSKGKKKKKTQKKGGSGSNPVSAGVTLQAFQLFQTGADFTDVMADLQIDDEKALELRRRFNRLRDEQLKGEGMEERYLQGTFVLARTMGEDIRSVCPHYSDESGCCDYWSFRDVDTKLRKKYPGMFKTVGNTIRPNISNQPQLCCLCDFSKERRTA